MHGGKDRFGNIEDHGSGGTVGALHAQHGKIDKITIEKIPANQGEHGYVDIDNG